jgi:hypothetical protein
VNLQLVAVLGGLILGGGCAASSYSGGSGHRDSVVLGHGISNHFLSIPPCPQDPDGSYVTICFDGNYNVDAGCPTEADGEPGKLLLCCQRVERGRI